MTPRVAVEISWKAPSMGIVHAAAGASAERADLGAQDRPPLPGAAGAPDSGGPGESPGPRRRRRSPAVHFLARPAASPRPLGSRLLPPGLNRVISGTAEG